MNVPLNFRDPEIAAAEVRAGLNLAPHPEGGHYREIWRDKPASGRGAASSILFLLAAGERSNWHRIDASEIWLWQAGAPLMLEICPGGGSSQRLRLGPGAGNAEAFQGVVPPHVWQAAQSLGAWSLVSCVVAPAFEFEHFELAASGWTPSPDGERGLQASSLPSGRETE
jgi:predicted cupin superfamily sugar epimerase